MDLRYIYNMDLRQLIRPFNHQRSELELFTVLDQGKIRDSEGVAANKGASMETRS